MKLFSKQNSLSLTVSNELLLSEYVCASRKFLSIVPWLDWFMICITVLSCGVMFVETPYCRITNVSNCGGVCVLMVCHDAHHMYFTCSFCN